MKVIIERAHDGLKPGFKAVIKWGDKTIFWTQSFTRKLVLLNSIRRMAENFCSKKWTVVDETK